MPANAQNTYSDYYQSSAYGSYVAESRIFGTPPVSLVHVKQPAGAFPDPALPFIALGLFRHCNTKLTGDMGAGRFQGRVTHGSIVVTALDTATDLVVDGPHSILITALPAVRVHRLFSQESWATMDFGILHAKVFRDDLVERLCIRLWNRVRQDEQSSLLVDAAVMTMVSCLMEHRGTKHAPFPTSKNNTSSQWRIKRAVDYLRANLEEDVDLSTLAAAAGLSPYHFARQFKHAMGVPPHQYLISCRIERACELLATTSFSVARIALDVGFGSPEHFAVVFRKRMGASPRAYRSIV